MLPQKIKWMLCLCLLILAACGEERFQGNEATDVPDTKAATSSGKIYSPTSGKKTNPQPSKVPGFICNAEGICIPETRASKNPKTDAFGFRKRVVALPYDDEEDTK